MARSIADPVGYFWGNDPNVNQKLRERIALQMMQSQGKYPKTLGEGLSAVGNAIGSRMMGARLEQGDLAQQNAAKTIEERLGGGAVTGSAPPAAAAPIASAPTTAAPGAAPSDALARIYSADEPSPLDPPAGAERDAAIRTIVAEAGNQPPEGQNAVASVIRNRAVNGGYGGENAGAVVQSPNQFEPWNTQGGRSRMAAIDPSGSAYANAGRALDSAYAGNDPTNGAMNFFAPRAQAALGRPPPAWGRGPGQDIGDHRFFGGRDPRAGVTSALVNQQGGAGVPQPNPTQPGATTPDDDGSILPPSAQLASGSQANLALAAPSATPLPPAPPPAQQITPAPRVAQQITPVPRGAPDPGYVMPEPGQIAPPSPVQMSPVEQAARREIMNNPNNPYVTQRLAPIVEREQALREFEQNRRLEQYKQDIQQRRELLLKREEQVATQAKRELDAKKLQQEIEQGYRPKLEEDVETKFVWDAQEGAYRRPRVVGESDVPQPSFKNLEQAKSFKFGEVMMDSMRGIGDAGSLANAPDALKARVPVAGNYLVSEDYRKAASYATRWIMTKLRDESGATIGTQEFARDMAAYFPVPGDDAKEIARKAQARKVVFDGMVAASGPQGRRVFDYREREHQRQKAEEDRLRNQPGGSRDNPVRVNSEAEANQLPKGTYGVLNGRPFKVN